MAEEARTSVAAVVSRNLWIPFVIWVVALVFSFRGHFLGEWRQNQLLNAVKNGDQASVETMFDREWYPANGLFGNPEKPLNSASLLEFALAAGNERAAQFFWEKLPGLHLPRVLHGAWKTAAVYGYPEGLLFMHSIDPQVSSASLTALIDKMGFFSGVTSDLKIAPADAQQRLRCLELLVSWGAVPASASADAVRTLIDSGLVDSSVFLIKHGARCATPDSVYNTPLHAVFRQQDLSPGNQELLTRLLLDHGVSATQSDSKGAKPLDLVQDLMTRHPTPEYARIIELLKSPPSPSGIVPAPLPPQAPVSRPTLAPEAETPPPGSVKGEQAPASLPLAVETPKGGDLR